MYFVFAGVFLREGDLGASEGSVVSAWHPNAGGDPSALRQLDFELDAAGLPKAVAVFHGDGRLKHFGIDEAGVDGL